MLTLFSNLMYLLIFYLVFLFVFNLALYKNKLLLRTICIFLSLHVALVAFILIEQHRFKINLSGSIFMDDGESFSGNGWQISTALTNNIPDISSIAQMRGIHVVDRCLGLKSYYNEYIKKKVILPFKEYQVRFPAYFYGVIYATYGFKPVLINFMNVILHLLTAILIYQSVSTVFNNSVAYLSTLFFLLNPLAFYYASTKLIESLFIFIVYLSIYCFLMAIKKKSYLYAFSIFPLLYIIHTLLKTQYFTPLIITFALSTIVVIFKKNKKLFFILSMIIIFVLYSRHTDVFEKTKSFTKNLLISSVDYQRGFNNSGGSTYRIYLLHKDAKDYTFTDWASYILRAWYHMLSEPILSGNISVKLLLYYPVKMVFLILCLLAVPGILMAMRYNYTDAVILICFLVVVGSSIAMSSGNIGSMLRHRNLIAPVIFIFSSFYISRFLVNKGTG